MRIFFFLLLSLLSVDGHSWGDDKIYTNEDLEQYQQEKPSVSVIPQESISYGDLMKRSGRLEPSCTEKMKAKLRSVGGECMEMREGESPDTEKYKSLPNEKDIDQGREDEEVLLNISGCPTLQDGIEGKTGNQGNAVFRILRHGRTIQEICDTVGQGCSSCVQLLQAR